MSVVIGVDPRKASHTAVAVDEQELPLGNLRVRSSAAQLDRLLEWATPWPQRTSAVENASGLGYLLAQQLIGAGERVIDIQPKLAARVRLLGATAVNKNDPNDARSIAVVALRNPGLTALTNTDHVEVIRIWVRRRRELGNHRTRVVNQLHTVLGELIAGGFNRRLSARQADDLLDAFTAAGPAAAARLEVGRDLITDVRRLDEQLREIDKRLRAEIGMTGTILTDIYGVGPVVAAMVLAMTGDVRRFPSADRFAAYAGTAPIEVSSGPHQVFRLSRRGESAPELRGAASRGHPDRAPHEHRPHLLRPQARPRPEPQNGLAIAEATDHHRPLSGNGQRHPPTTTSWEPGRTTGARL